MIWNVDGVAFKGAPSTCAGKSAKLVTWDHSCRSAAPTFHVDMNALEPELKGAGPHYAWVLETPAWTDRVLLKLAPLMNRFEKIFTHSTVMANNGIKCYWAPASGIWIKDMRIHPKTKLCSMITSAKTALPGHRERVRWARAHQNMIDVFGLDSSIRMKEEGLCDYMFSVAMENAVSAGYFTEKILDCFATGTVPIYCGAPDIGDFFNPAGIIKLDETFTVKGLSRERYESMLPAIQENFERVMEYEIPEDYIARRYFQVKEKTRMNLSQAINAGDLVVAEALVKEIRLRPDAGAVERGLAALTLALAYYNKEQLAEAEQWSLRSLHGNFRADALKLLGEIALDRMDYESAIGWYEAAGAITHEPPISLVASEPGRLEEIRRESVENVRPVRFGPPDDESHALVVQTTEGRDKLREQTLASLDAAGAGRWRGPRILIVDGTGVGAPSPGWIAEGVRDQGQAKTFFRGLRAAIALGAKRLTLFEDDVVLAKNALDYIARVVPSEDAPITVWWSELGAPFRQGPPMYLFTDAFIRNVAISMSCETAQKILDSGVVKNWSERHAGDMAYAKAFPGAKAALHFPGLVQHMGDESLVGETEIRKSSTFIGVDADAMTLI